MPLTDLSVLCRGLCRWTKTKINFLYSAQEIHTIRKNKRLGGVNLSLFKTSSDILKVRAQLLNSMQILSFHLLLQREHICIFTKAHCVNLGFLWLDNKVDKEKTHFSFNIIFFIPKNEILNSAKVFLALILFYYYFFNKKLVVPLVPEVLRSADPWFRSSVFIYSQ